MVCKVTHRSYTKMASFSFDNEKIISSFPEYKFKSCLGSGGDGMVYEVSDGEGKYALKLFVEEPKEREKQDREYNNLKKLEDKNVVKVYASSNREIDSKEFLALLPEDAEDRSNIFLEAVMKEKLNVIYITLELCGENLRNYLKQETTRNANTQAEIVKNIISAVKYLHDQKILHRDLKPENIMFSHSKYTLPVKIGDFGSSKNLETDKSVLTRNVGTDPYQAPEASSKKYSNQRDIYSVGLIMWETLQPMTLGEFRIRSSNLINDGDENQVELNKEFYGSEKVIISFCQRCASNRPTNLHEILLPSIFGYPHSEKRSGYKVFDWKWNFFKWMRERKDSKIKVMSNAITPLKQEEEETNSTQKSYEEEPEPEDYLTEFVKFQGYQLKRFLGSGSFGVVWEANEGNGEKGFAIKVVLIDPENEERQRREHEISLQLHHENLVQVIRIDRIAIQKEELKILIPQNERNSYTLIFALRERKMKIDIFCLKLELCGENLRKWLRKEHDPSSLKTKTKQKEIVTNVVEGLKYLHFNRIIHRDLKPENIMFTSRGYFTPVKIGDYGTCRVLKEPQTSTLTADVGTDLYRAPETSSNYYSFQSDLFSLGLVIWEVLQIIPFQKLRHYADRLLHDREENLVKIDPFFGDMKKIILKLCQKKPENRPKDLDEIIFSAPFQTEFVASNSHELELCQKKAENRPEDLDEITLSAPFQTEFIASNSFELQEILDNCVEGSTIQLLEKKYIGNFRITKNNLTLKGGQNTTISSPLNRGIVLAVFKGDFKASNFTVSGSSGSGYEVGVYLSAGCNCLLENLVVKNIATIGIYVSPDSNNCKIKNSRFEKTSLPVFLSGSHSTLKNIVINNCSSGVEVFGGDGTSIKILLVKDPEKFGVAINSCKAAKIEEVQIETTQETKRESAKLDTLFSIRNCPEGKFAFRNVTGLGFGGEGVECGLFSDENSLSADVNIRDCKMKKIGVEILV